MCLKVINYFHLCSIKFRNSSIIRTSLDIFYCFLTFPPDQEMLDNVRSLFHWAWPSTVLRTSHGRLLVVQDPSALFITNVSKISLEQMIKLPVWDIPQESTINLSTASWSASGDIFLMLRTSWRWLCVSWPSICWSGKLFHLKRQYKVNLQGIYLSASPLRVGLTYLLKSLVSFRTIVTVSSTKLFKTMVLQHVNEFNSRTTGDSQLGLDTLILGTVGLSKDANSITQLPSQIMPEPLIKSMTPLLAEINCKKIEFNQWEWCKIDALQYYVQGWWCFLALWLGLCFFLVVLDFGLW